MQVTLSMDTVNCDFLAAACCEQVHNFFGDPHHPNYIDAEKFGDSTGHFHEAERAFPEISTQTNWADHGFLNAAWSNVSFLYELSKTLATTGAKLTTLHETAIAKALVVAQGWKALMIQKERSQHGEHWGAATSFFNDNMTAYCPALLGEGPLPVEVIFIDPRSNSIYPLTIAPLWQTVIQRIGGDPRDGSITYLGRNAFYCMNRQHERWFSIDRQQHFRGPTLIAGRSRDGDNTDVNSTDLLWYDLGKKIRWQPDPDAEKEHG